MGSRPSKTFGMDQGEDEVDAKGDGHHEASDRFPHGGASQTFAHGRIRDREGEQGGSDDEKEGIEHGTPPTGHYGRSDVSPDGT